MPRIVVERTLALWQDRARSYRVFVDGKERGRVANGSTVGIAVAPGSHVVTMKISWCRSKELRVDVGPDSTCRLKCGPNSTPLLAVLYPIFFYSDYIWLREAGFA